MKRAWALYLLIPLFSACSSSPGEDPSLNSRNVVLARAGDCAEAGDLNCAQKNYCELRAADESDVPAGLHCCLSMFLRSYFSENTRELGKLLGYQPADFTEVKKSSLLELLAKKKLPFGELVFLSASQAPAEKPLFTEWAKTLVAAQASTDLLNRRVRALGEDLEAVHGCLNKVAPKFDGEETLEPRFFGAPEKINVTPREIRFFQFASGGLSYLTQFIFQYEWGFEQFPTWPPADSFYQDINGHLAVGDLRFGDLSDLGAQAIVSQAGLLRDIFKNYELFLSSGGSPSRIDAWLQWRFSSETLNDAKGIFSAAGDSLESGGWVGIPSSEYSINLSSLLSPQTLPNAALLPAGIDLLVKDANQIPTVNLTYLHELFKNLVSKK